LGQHAGYSQGPPPDNGLEVLYKSASFNDKMLGRGEPIRVRVNAFYFDCSMLAHLRTSLSLYPAII